MTNRETAKHAFLTTCGWEGAARVRIAGDASNRSYDRLVGPEGRSAILMDAPPEKGEDVRPFIDAASYLSAHGLSAPQIIASDIQFGFLLLEDLGDALFARVVEKDPVIEPVLYAAATDVLCHLHQQPAPAIGTYDPKLMTDLACLAFDWYQMGIVGEVDQPARASLAAKLNRLLTETFPTRPVLIQRDYHAENLLWLPDRTGVARVGLLDFQDALLGHPAYDLVSILQDARRDVDTALAEEMIQRYVAATNTDEDAFRFAYALQGLQRNLRIIGVFARLSLMHGKPHYIDLLPRVFGHLETDIAHPKLAELGKILRSSLPPPTPENLNILKEKCGTFQSQS